MHTETLSKLKTGVDSFNTCLRYAEWASTAKTLEDFEFYFEILQTYFMRLHESDNPNKLLDDMKSEGCKTSPLYIACEKWGKV